MGLPPGRTDVDGPGPPRTRPGGRSAGRWVVTLVLLAAAAACYVGIVAARSGPPAGGDTTPLTAVTSALADGDLRVAASVESLPNPPGYPLLAAPFVAAFPSAVGSPTWCTPASRYPAPPVGGHRAGSGLIECGSTSAVASLPPWYRAQGLLGVASWLVLALGALAVLRAARADSGGARGGAAGLSRLPAGGQQRHRPALPSPGRGQPGLGAGRAGPDPAARVGVWPGSSSGRPS